MLPIILLIYILLINIAGFIMMGSDKKRARKGVYRISEKALFTVSIIGGSAGTWTGMYFFRHKTRHWYFVVFIPLIIAVQVLITVFLVIKGII